MIDIGANLGHESFRDDLDAVLARARHSGVEQIVVTGTSVEASRRALELAYLHRGTLFATAGIHPHDATTFNAHSLPELRSLAADPLVVALGEAGLDFNRNYSPQDAQESAFAAQLDLAVELQKPLFLHQRDAHERFMHLLLPRLPFLGKVVVHCFTGTRQELEDYLSHDLYIGVTGWICDERRGHHLHELLPLIPQNRLMIETDAPYLLPRTITPRPGTRRNEPANLNWVVKSLAECTGADADLIRKNTAAVARDFFNLELPSRL